MLSLVLLRHEDAWGSGRIDTVTNLKLHGHTHHSFHFSKYFNVSYIQTDKNTKLNSVV
jgi:hypothetical protein